MVALALFPVLPVSALALVPVDDFEIGGFNLICESQIITQEIVLESSAPHTIYWKRKLELRELNGTATATLNPGSQPDDALVYSPPTSNTGDLRITYDWGFAGDLTVGGTMDRFDFDLRQIVSGGRVSVSVDDADGNSQPRGLTLFSTGVVSIDLSGFVNVDVTRATRITIVFDPDSHSGTYEVADIRLRGPDSGVLTFDGDLEFVVTPPIPTPPIVFTAYDPIGQPLYDANIVLQDVDAGYVPETRFQWQDVPGMGGELSTMSFDWLEPDFSEAWYEVTIQLSAANGSTPSLPLPSLGQEERSLLLEFPVTMTDSQGADVGSSRTRLILDVFPLQTLSFQEASVLPLSPTPGSSDGFRVRFLLSNAGEFDWVFPILESTWISDWTEGQTTDVEPVPPTERNPRQLSAWPSVVSESTTLRTSRPFEMDRVVSILDASGRGLRRLTWDVGTTEVVWDGRDARGANAPTGIYFARVAGYRGGVVRLIKIR